MDQAPQHRKIAGQAHYMELGATRRRATMRVPDPRFPVTPLMPDLPLINSRDAAAKALQDYFLSNADRGDNAANDELIDALISRIRAQQVSINGGHR